MVLATTIISFLGSLFIITSLLFFTHADKISRTLQSCGIQSFNFAPSEKVGLGGTKIAFRLVFNVACSDLLYEISFWFSNPDTPSDSHTCRFSGWLQQFGTLASILWVTIITYVIHEVVLDAGKDVAKMMPYYHAFVWGTSFITSFLPLFSSSYGQAGGWCWIESHGWGLAWRFIVFYIPVWLIIFYIIYIYHDTWKHMRSMQAPIVKRMALYPAILVGSWTIGTINRIVQAAGKESYGLTCLHAFFMSLYGFMNCLAYLANVTVREELQRYCCGVSTLNNTMMTPSKREPHEPEELAYDLNPVLESFDQFIEPNGQTLPNDGPETLQDVKINKPMTPTMTSDENLGPSKKTSEIYNVDIAVGEDSQPSQDVIYATDGASSRDVIYAQGSSSDFQQQKLTASSPIEVQTDYPIHSDGKI